MNDFQEQAKNWLRNVVKQNPDKIKAGVQKAGDLIDQQTGGKYAEKVDSVQEKVGKYVDSQSGGAPADVPEGPGNRSEDVPEGPGNRSHDDGATTVGGEVPEPSPDSSAGSDAAGAETGSTVSGTDDTAVDDAGQTAGADDAGAEESAGADDTAGAGESTGAGSLDESLAPETDAPTGDGATQSTGGLPGPRE
ncbi:antitoxin [Kribbella sandramycini]|uniref:Antitoxin protein of toxin-antitoxin system n=1 Tax=Kribbella sandramycini TaxID=60450 RepID=A0A841SBP8_9ACTN|nr:antitoxin [Kribbella sandramycini]MBB6568699.1 hypothetical protein [Kribbella sandramycini]